MADSTGILAGKNILITGVLSKRSIAFAVARLAQQQGAEIILTSFGSAAEKTRRAATHLDFPAPVIEFDASRPEDVDALTMAIRSSWDRVDGVVHAIAFAPSPCLGGSFLKASWADVATALQVSAYSLKALADATVDLMPAGSSIVGLDFDASVAWPEYNWMGVAKATLEAITRYLARELGQRQVSVNLVASGPLRTVASAAIPGFAQLEGLWSERAPLDWNAHDLDPTSRACIVLLSDWLPKVTGHILYVDGGAVSMGI